MGEGIVRAGQKFPDSTSQQVHRKSLQETRCCPLWAFLFAGVYSTIERKKEILGHSSKVLVLSVKISEGIFTGCAKARSVRRMRRAKTLREAYSHLFEQGSHGTSGLMISEQDVTRLFKWVHLSANRLGGDRQNMFTFTPRIPLTPSSDRLGDVVEDDFTRRISVAPTISQAAKALGSDYLSGFWVYAVDLREDGTDDVAAIDLSQTLPDCDTDLSYEDVTGTMQTYSDDGAEYKLSDWLEQVTDEEYSAPSEMPPDLQKSWQGCVPDAYKTEEHWLTSPTPFVLLGRLVMNGSKNFVNLTPWAIEELRDYHDHLGISVPKRVLAAAAN